MEKHLNHHWVLLLSPNRIEELFACSQRGAPRLPPQRSTMPKCGGRACTARAELEMLKQRKPWPLFPQNVSYFWNETVYPRLRVGLSSCSMHLIISWFGKIYLIKNRFSSKWYSRLSPLSRRWTSLYEVRSKFNIVHHLTLEKWLDMLQVWTWYTVLLWFHKYDVLPLLV